MFTGLIREMATVQTYRNNQLTLKASYVPKIGDSIAINGACLTVVKLQEGSFTVELSPETQTYIAVENLKGKVHMEPAMQMGERFEGHIVQGHVDCLG
jgi:riboflavin synthase